MHNKVLIYYREQYELSELETQIYGWYWRI